MPAEPLTVLLRPRHFFTKNPALGEHQPLSRASCLLMECVADVPPTFSSWPSQVKAKTKPYDAKDKYSAQAKPNAEH